MSTDDKTTQRIVDGTYLAHGRSLMDRLRLAWITRRDPDMMHLPWLGSMTVMSSGMLLPDPIGLTVCISFGILGTTMTSKVLIAQNRLDRGSLLAIPFKRPSRLAKTIAKALRTQWSDCEIKGDVSWPEHSRHPVVQNTISMPGGFEIVLRRSDNEDLVSNARTHHDAVREFSGDDAWLIKREVSRLQTRSICNEMGLPADRGSHALAHAIGLASPVDAERTVLPAQRELAYPIRTIEKRHIDRIGLEIVCSHSGNRRRLERLVVSSVCWGAVSLPPAAFEHVTRNDEAHVAAESIGMESYTRVPLVPPGTNRGIRIVEIGEKLLSNDPNATDASGALLAPLVREHLPRIMRTHAESDPATCREADETLEKALDIAAGAIGQCLDATASRNLDALRTELRFLESRHPSVAEAINDKTRT